MTQLEAPGEARDVDGVCLAIDIGGTKIAVGAVDAQGRVLAQNRVSTPRGDRVDATTLLRTLRAAVAELPEPETPYVGVGIGCGRPMRWPEGVVSTLNIPAWREFPLRDEVRAWYPDIPVRLHNDAICTAIAEHWLGAGRGTEHMLGMVISTGVGGGLILGGHLIDGRTGNAGHIGHVIVDPREPKCACGATGCLEAVASGPNLAAWASAQGWRVGLPENERTARDLAADAARGHDVALRAMHRAGRALGIAIASITVACDLEVVALGGGLSQAGPLLFDPLHDTYKQYVGVEYARDVRIVPVELGQDASLIGAAALVLRAGAYWSAD